MIFTTQVEFNKFYDRIMWYANSKALRLFSDEGLRGEVVDKAMDKLTNEILKNPQDASIEAFAKVLVYNSLKNSARDKKLDLIPINIKLTQEDKQILGEVTQIKQEVYKGKYPKVALLNIENSKERKICLMYWQYGYNQDEIAKIMKISQSTISRIIAKYSK